MLESIEVVSNNQTDFDYKPRRDQVFTIYFPAVSFHPVLHIRRCLRFECQN